jgi:hypothetical protein
VTTEERYQETVDGIALARRTVEQTAATIRQAMDNGDDPVIFLHNLSVALGKESPFQSGGQGAAIYTVACFLLAESGFFEPPDLREKCICTGPPDGEFVATCPIHRGSWAETLEILADRELSAELTRDLDAEEQVAIAEEMLPAGVEALAATEPWCSGYCAEVPMTVGFHDPRCSEYVEPCCVEHSDTECPIDAPESCCGECPALGRPEPVERRYGLRVGQCTDPDCFQAGCDGGHDELRCPTTGVVRGNIATVNSHWVCCGGLYPDHAERKTCACRHVMDDHMSLIGPCTMGCDCIRFEAWGTP